MGSYSTLSVDKFSLGEWKSHIPLEGMLLFTQDDFHETPGGDDAHSRYQFLTTAAVARQRLEARGLTLDVSREMYDRFRADTITEYNLTTNVHRTRPNPVTFPKYLAACKAALADHTSHSPISGGEKKPSKRLKLVFGDGFFDDDSDVYFGDAIFCVMMRAFLEVAPPKSKVCLDCTDLVHGGYLDLKQTPRLHDYCMNLLYQRIGIDYQLFGFVLEEDPSVDRRLRERIAGLSEDQFIDHVLLPLLKKMGFQRVRKVDYHGRNEFGSDIMPFRFTTPLNTLEYYAVQAKAVPIHGTSSKQGNAGELLSQTMQAFSVAFVDDLDNERKHIDKFVVATNKAISPDARHVIESGVEGRRKVVFLDLDGVVALVKQHRLVQYLLFTPM